MPGFDHLRLQTERLQLRPLTHADAADLFAIYSSAEVSRYLLRGQWTHVDQAHQRIARDIDAMAAGESLRLGLERRGDKRIVGDMCLFNIMKESRRAELGYSLARDAWGRGFACEALKALVGLAFGELGLNRLEADIDPRNDGSRKALERLGFTHEGMLPERWIVNGEACDTSLYGLLRRHWDARQAA